MTTKRYRLRFWPTAQVRMDPLEFAWMLSRHHVQVVSLIEPCTLEVRCAYRGMLDGFVDAVNDAYGPLIFEGVDALVGDAWEEV